MPANRPIKVNCIHCGNEPKNHTVLKEEERSDSSPDGDITVWTIYQIIQCAGCDAIRFRQYNTCTEDYDERTGQLSPYNIQVFPLASIVKRQSIDKAHVPPTVAKMYEESLLCFNSGAHTLAGGGLRATVEAICLDRGITNGTLHDKINDLAKQGFLAQAQADLLHEERILGNQALHELRTPSEQDLADSFTIIEGLISTLYVLPRHASRLKASRSKPTKTSKKSAKKKP